MPASADPWDEVTERLGSFIDARIRQVSPPVERWSVVSSNPLVVQSDDDVQLSETDEDVEVDRGLIASRPAPGSTVRVHSDGDGWVIGGMVV